MKKKVLSAVMALGLVIGSGVQVFAQPTDAEKVELELKQQEYRQAESKLQELEATLQIYDNEIGKLSDEISANKQNISKTEGQIKKIQKEIEQAKKELKEKQDLFDTRMRAIYKSGSPGYLEMIVNSENFSDLVSNVKAIGKLMDFDKKIINDLNDKKKELDDKKASLDEEVVRLNGLKEENEKKLAQVSEKKKEQQKLVDQAREERKKVKVNLAQKERDMIAFPKSIIDNPNSSTEDLKGAIKALDSVKPVIIVIDPELEELSEKGKKVVKNREEVSRSRGGSTSSNAVVNYAYNFMGVPYVWGGTTPSGFDCSGFTSYVYRALGYNIGRDTYAQIGQGSSVSYSELQPGDLVFTNGVGHVGIYVGNGQMIHAPRTGRNVEVSPIYGFSGARRIIR